MRFRNLDLNLLAALDQLIRLRSVSRAADELAITQSAMSNALNRLRQYFDDPLLVQVGRRMELTPRAEALSGPVRDILVRIEATVTTPPQFDPATTTRQIGLMVSDYTLHTLVPPFLRRIARAAPGLQVEIRPQQTYPYLQLERGETDLLVAPEIYCSPDHPMRVLLADPFVVVLDEDHPSARAGAIDEAAFLAAEYVTMKPPLAGESFVSVALRDRGIALRAAVTCYSFAALPDLVRGTARLALLQERLARRMQRMGGIAILPVPFALPPLSQAVQWHRMRGQDPALGWLIDQMVAAVPEI